jgi:serine/threonine-protein kinase
MSGVATPRLWLRRAALGVLLAGSLVLVFGMAAWFTLRASVRFVSEITVPAVVGSDQADASARLRALGLQPRVTGQRADPTRPAGKVLDQFPAAGSRSKPGRPVRLVLSSGPEKTIVPDLAGSSVSRAQLALRRAGLSLGTTSTAPHPGQGPGRILAQHPAAGSDGSAGQAIAVLVSAGSRPRAFVMPDFVGRSAATAVRSLEGLGFRSVVLGGAGEIQPGAVIRDQRPPVGSRITSTSRITLTPAP